MSTCKRLISAGRTALGVVALSVLVCTGALAQAPAVDPAAVQKMKRMFDFLDAQQQFSVETQSIVEEIGFSKHRVDYDLTANVVVKRPNKLSAVRTGELLNEHLYYDGKTLTLYRPGDKTYASATAPDTIERMVDFARETIGILLPAADLVYRGAYPLMMQDVSLAAVVGKATIGGVSCDHLLFSRPGVDFQVWIASGEKPWPCKYVVTETETPTKLSITTFLSGWNFSPVVQRQRPSPTTETDGRPTMKSMFKIAATVLVLLLMVPEAHALRGRGAAFAVGAAVGSANAAPPPPTTVVVAPPPAPAPAPAAPPPPPPPPPK